MTMTSENSKTMRIIISILCLIITPAAFGQITTSTDPHSVWQGVIELPPNSLARYVLNDLPGMMCVLVPTSEGPKPYLLGDKVLKAGIDLPKLNAQPNIVVSAEISGDKAADISYIAFVSAEAGKTNDVKFTATETANSEILDNQIDWANFNRRVSSIKQANPNLPKGTLFGVVQVASVLTISYQTFSSVNSSGKISGWGFSGNGKYLTQESELSNTYKVGVYLTYSDADISQLIPTNQLMTTVWTETAFRPTIQSQIKQNIQHAMNLSIGEQTKMKAEILSPGDLIK